MNSAITPHLFSIVLIVNISLVYLWNNKIVRKKNNNYRKFFQI